MAGAMLEMCELLKGAKGDFANAAAESIETSLKDIKVEIPALENLTIESVLDTTTGDRVFKNGETKINTDALLEAGKEGNFSKILESLGIDVGKIEPSVIKDLQATMDANKGVIERKGLAETNKAGKELKRKSNGTAETARTDEELKLENKEVLDALKDKIKTLQEQSKVDAAANKSTTVGRWAKRVLTVGVIAGLSYLGILELAKKHQREVNGCWLVRARDGLKCKIKDLSCKDEVEGAASSADICNFSDDKGIILKCDDVRFPKPDDKNRAPHDNCFVLGRSCSVAQKDEQGNNQCLTFMANVQPTECATCGQCMENTLPVPFGFRLQCVDMTIFDAVEDMVPNPLKDVLGGLKGILMWVLIGVGVIAGVVCIYYLIRMLVALGSSGKGKRGSSSSSSDVTLTLKR